MAQRLDELETAIKAGMYEEPEPETGSLESLEPLEPADSTDARDRN